MCKLKRFVICLSIVTSPALLLAKPEGKVQKSGKQGSYCNSCHNSPGDSTAPTVSFGAEVEIFAGQKKNFTFKIERTSESHTKCGFNIAADAGTLSAESPNIRKQSGELTHTAPWGYDDSTDLCIFPFQWTAPDELGTYTLYAAGNSVNDNDATSGDFPATTTVEIEVVAGDDGDDDDDDSSGDDDDDDSSGDDDDDDSSGDDDDDDSSGDDDDDDDSGDNDDDNTGSTGTNGSESGPKSAGGCSATGMASCSLLVGLLFALGLVRKRRRKKF